MSPTDCFTPAMQPVPGSAAADRLLDAHRAVRYDGLLQLIDEVQRRRTTDEVARVVAARWKHCSSVTNWRLLCVYNQRCALVVVQGSHTTVNEMDLAELPEFDILMWRRRVPRHWISTELQEQRPALPAELADARGLSLSILPLQQGTTTIGILSVLSCEKVFDNLDRKFNSLVAGAMAARFLAILTEQSLTADLMRAQRQILEQRQAGIMGRLVNGVAHEINTPLGVQIAACDALASMLAEPESAAEYAQDISDTIALIDQQARRAAGIVKRLKQISAAAVASPRMDTPLLEELTLIAEAHADLDIRIQCPPALALQLDRTALATVLSELLDNAQAHGGCARRAAPVLLEVQQLAQQVRISITDHGPGFAPGQAEHFHDPFFTSRQNQGHIGIGGYIAQNLARDALSATLELQTVAGRTTVSLVFAAA